MTDDQRLEAAVEAARAIAPYALAMAALWVSTIPNLSPLAMHADDLVLGAALLAINPQGRRPSSPQP